jgi:preprotein translocase subunit SecG
MHTLILSLHILVCVLVVLVVLVQSGKGAGFSGLLGGGSGSGDALFSAPSGSSFMRKVTGGLAAGFLLTSLLLTYMASRRGLRTVTRNQWSAPAQTPPPTATPEQ